MLRVTLGLLDGAGNCFEQPLESAGRRDRPRRRAGEPTRREFPDSTGRR